MSDTPTIRFGRLEADATDSAPLAVDPRADLALLLHVVGHLLEYQEGSLAREQRALLRHATERATLLERLLLLEEQVSALMVAEHRR